MQNVKKCYSVTIRFHESHPITHPEIAIYLNWVNNHSPSITRNVTTTECPNGPNSKHIQGVFEILQANGRDYSNNYKKELIRKLPRPKQQCENSNGKNVAIIVKKIKDGDDHVWGYPLKDIFCLHEYTEVINEPEIGAAYMRPGLPESDMNISDEWHGGVYCGIVHTEVSNLTSTDGVAYLLALRDGWRKWKKDNPSRKRKRDELFILCRKHWPQMIMEYAKKHNIVSTPSMFNASNTMFSTGEDYVKVIIRHMVRDVNVQFQMLSPGRRYLILNERLKPIPDYDTLVNSLYETVFMGVGDKSNGEVNAFSLPFRC